MITKARQREHEEERASVRAHILSAFWGYKCDCHFVVNICSQNTNPYNMSKPRQKEVRVRQVEEKKGKQEEKSSIRYTSHTQFYVLHSVGEMDLYRILFRLSSSHNESASQLQVLFYFYVSYGTSSRFSCFLLEE